MTAVRIAEGETPTLSSLIDARAAATPDRTMALDGVTTLSFGEYRNRCVAVAEQLAALGVGAGDVVAWQLPTWIDTLVVTGALDRVGAIQVPLLPMLAERDVSFIAAEAGVDWYVHPGEWRGTDYGALADGVNAALGGRDPMGMIRLERGTAEHPPGLAGQASTARSPRPAADDDDVRWYFYTSGTTGRPKGVRHRTASVLAATEAMGRAFELTPDDRSVIAFPVSHIGGINWLLAALGTGCSLLMIESFAAEGVMDLISASGVTLAGVTAAFHQAYLAAQRADPSRRLLPEVRAYPGGAAPKPPALHRALVAEVGGVGIVSGFGLTEFPMITMNSVTETSDDLAETEGLPSLGVEVLIAGPDGRACPVGVDGEICARGRHTMVGYVDAALDVAFDAAGFFHTGDLGHLRGDGRLVVTGRLKDVIIRKGENVSARELEDLLHELDEVTEAAVVGIPDEERGEMVCAVVVPSPGADVDLARLVDALTARGVTRHKLPERLETRPALPRNSAGKILKTELRDQLAADRRGEDGGQ